MFLSPIPPCHLTRCTNTVDMTKLLFLELQVEQTSQTINVHYGAVDSNGSSQPWSIRQVFLYLSTLSSLLSCPVWSVGPLRHCLLNAFHHFLALRIHPTSSIYTPGAGIHQRVMKYQLLKNKVLEIANLDDGSWNCIIITNKFHPRNRSCTWLAWCWQGISLPFPSDRMWEP